MTYKRLLIVVSILLTGCQPWESWQPYAALYPTAAATPTQPQDNPTDPAATPQGVCIVIADEALNLRAGAGTSYAVKDWLEAGDSLTLTGNQRGAWIEVVTNDHVRGWVNSNYCKR